ncbi:MAG: SCP2 sterol-binding domain-containing protein [Oscillospiraceae bacterium]|jgi:putative sterol carrier protein|nr:SCP2 sterol-binding domain-containing protein [Oscillospiraceae bacterium]
MAEAKKPVAKAVVTDAKPAVKATTTDVKAEAVAAKPVEVKAPQAAAAPAKKPEAKPAPAKKPAAKKEPEKSIDVLQNALWAKFEKANTDGADIPLAIQIDVYDFGTLYLALRDDGKHVQPYPYQGNDGVLSGSYDNIAEFIDGKLSFHDAVLAKKLNFYGDLRKFLAVRKFLDI